MTVLSIDTEARTNADLIEACRDLGYLTDDQSILDPTYGEGRFWRSWEPAGLAASDLDPTKSPVGYAINFTWMPHPDDSFDAVVFDPPYKLNGTGGSHPSDAGYGVADRWGGGIHARHTLIRKGISECTRVLKRRGILLVKCQDQVSSGKVHWQTREFADHAESLGHRQIDALHLLGHREQPPGRRQVHARKNYSTLMVFRLERKLP